MKYRLCPICMGNMIQINDPWTGGYYYQCMGCGFIDGEGYI